MKIVYLKKNDLDPDPEQDKYWILLEGNGDGTYHGTGFGIRAGDEKIYISNLESDKSLEEAITAATFWAEDSGVSVIYVRD